MTYRVDLDRLDGPECGIPIRGQLPDGTHRTVDAAHLDGVSLLRWLRSRDGRNPWAEQAVFLLLGHDPAALEMAREVVEVSDAT